MTDIVERLRKDRMPLPYQTVLEAADEIERLLDVQTYDRNLIEALRAEIERLRAKRQNEDLDETTIGYKIDAAYRRADMYLCGSDRWHYWMDEAKRLETLVREPV